MLPIGFLLLMHVDPVSILVPVMSGFVALSFVFAPSMQQFVTCLVFVLILHPFDVGDVVVIEDVPYRVDKITVMKTSFMAILSNARVYMPNTKWVAGRASVRVVHGGVWAHPCPGGPCCSGWPRRRSRTVSAATTP